jgi:DNA-binding CsgD family transcriptional regulator
MRPSPRVEETPTMAYDEQILALYRTARSMCRTEFQDFAVKTIRPILNFDSAIWGRGYFDENADKPQLVPVSTHTHEIDPAGFEYWKSINRADKIIPIVRKAPWATHNFHAPTLFAARSDAIMRDYAHRFGRQSYLVTALADDGATLFEWCSLYRPDPDAIFTDTERAACELLVRHMSEALKVNQLLDGVEPPTPRPGARQYTALTTRDGRLVSAQDGFLRLCALEWREFDGRHLPRPVNDLVIEARRPLRARRLFMSGRAVGDMFWLEAFESGSETLLPPRQMDVAQLYAEGYGHKEIARILHVSPSTVRNQITASYRSLQVSSRAGLRSALRRDPDAKD